MLNSKVEGVLVRQTDSSTLDTESGKRVEIERESVVVELALDASRFRSTLGGLRAKYSDNWIEVRYRYPKPDSGITVPGFVRASLVERNGTLFPALVGFISGVNIDAIQQWNNSSQLNRYTASQSEKRLIAASQIASQGMLGLMEKAGARCEDGTVALDSSSDHLTPTFGLLYAIGAPSQKGEEWLYGQGISDTTQVGEVPHELHESDANSIGSRLGMYSKLQIIGGAEHGDLQIWHPKQLENGAALFEVIRPEEARILTPENLSVVSSTSIAVGSELHIVPSIGPSRIEKVMDKTFEGIANNDPLRALRQSIRS